jgi:hypothetical protein
MQENKGRLSRYDSLIAERAELGFDARIPSRLLPITGTTEKFRGNACFRAQSYLLTLIIK